MNIVPAAIACKVWRAVAPLRAIDPELAGSLSAGEERAGEARRLVEEQRAVFDRGLDLAALVPFVPRRNQDIVRVGGDRLLPQHAVGLAAPAIGDRTRRRPAELCSVVAG